MYRFNYLAFLGISFLLSSGGGNAQQSAWCKHFGTARYDTCSAQVTDLAGNTYVAGHTFGVIGETNAGGADVIVSKFNASGDLVWHRQFGTPKYDEASAMALGGNGNIYVAGNTEGDLASPSLGESDVFVAELTPAGERIWTAQVGTSADDHGYAIAVDSQGNVYLGGETVGNMYATNTACQDIFILKFAPDHSKTWGKQLGGLKDVEISGIAVNGDGNVFMCGTAEDLFAPASGAPDSFIAKLDSAGNVVWGKQFGTENIDGGGSLVLDSPGNIYVSGSMNASEPQVKTTIAAGYVARFTPDGTQVWLKQWSAGLRKDTTGGDIIIGSHGKLYVSGSTGGSIFGTAAGLYDVYAIKLDTSGNDLWHTQFGSSGMDRGGVGVDSSGSIYIAGTTDGDLCGPNLGKDDVFLKKIVP